MADTSNSNYYSGNNTNPGFTTGNGTVAGQQGGMSVGQAGSGVNVLQQLLQYLNTPNTQGKMQGGMSVGGNAQNNAYQKGVQKALTESGYAHAQQAIQAGVDPQQIANHPIMQGGQGQQPMQGGGQSQQPQQGMQQSPSGQQINPQAMAVLQQLVQGNQGGAQALQSGVATPPPPQVANGNPTPNAQGIGGPQVNNPNILPPSGPFQNTGYNPQTGQIQEGGWVNRGLRGFATEGPLGLLQGLLGPSLGAQMGATKEAQLLKAGQPGETALPAAQARGQRAAARAQELENTGQQPVQKGQMMAAQTAAQEKQIQALTQEKDAESANLQALIKTQSDIMSHPTAMLMGGAQLKDLHSGIQTSMDRIKDIQSKLDSSQSNYGKKFGLGTPDQSSSGGGIKVGDKFNGETVMNVRRIK